MALLVEFFRAGSKRLFEMIEHQQPARPLVAEITATKVTKNNRVLVSIVASRSAGRLMTT